MRSWSLHPSLLDGKALVACWSETIQGRYALLGLTKRHKNHPQLNRFKRANNPILTINTYLYYIYQEAVSRGFKFDEYKIGPVDISIKVPVSREQLLLESKLLNEKISSRKKIEYKYFMTKESLINPKQHFMFDIVEDYDDQVERGSKVIKEWSI